MAILVNALSAIKGFLLKLQPVSGSLAKTDDKRRRISRYPTWDELLGRSPCDIEYLDDEVVFFSPFKASGNGFAAVDWPASEGLEASNENALGIGADFAHVIGGISTLTDV